MEITKTPNARVIKFKNPAEMVESAFEERKNGKTSFYGDHSTAGSWTGRRFNGWDDLHAKFYQPWDEGLQTVRGFSESLSTCDLPSPTSIKRKQTWNEDDGDIDVTRYLNQEDNFYRRAFRKKTHGIQIVSIVCCIADNANVSAQAMFWRNAAVVAAVDILEQAGYSCEINAFLHGGRTYPSAPSDSFICCTVKEAGTDVDIGYLTNCMSSWFCRNVCFTNLYLAGMPNRGLGSNRTDYSTYSKFLEVDAGCIPVAMPSVYSKESSLKAIKEIITQVTRGE